jgi:hypothetical protein
MRIEKAIRTVRAKFVVVDTINDFVDCNLLNNQAVRKTLRPLREVAERTQAAAVILRHFTKSSSGRSLHRGGGSVAITAMARSQLKLYVHPNDPYLRVLVQDKCNLGPLAPSVAFEIVQAEDNQFRLEWHGEVPLTVEDFEGKRASHSKLETAERFLLEELADGDQEVNSLLERSTGLFSKRTLDEAKKSLGVTTRRKGKGGGHRVYWSLTPA